MDDDIICNPIIVLFIDKVDDKLLYWETAWELPELPVGATFPEINNNESDFVFIDVILTIFTFNDGPIELANAWIKLL